MAKPDKPNILVLAALIALACLTGCFTALFNTDNSAGVAPSAWHHNGSARTLDADSSRSKRTVVMRGGTVELAVAKQPLPKPAWQALVSLDHLMTVMVAGGLSLIVPAFAWLWRRIDESDREGEG